MKLLVLTVTAIATFLSLSATAATYKCVIDGKTTYQETPCADDVKGRGTQSVIAPPSRKANSVGIETTSAAENKRRDNLVKSDLEPRAREAFATLKSGQAMAYRDMLCLRARQLLNHPAMKDNIKNTAEDLTKRNVEIEALSSASSLNVSFTAVPNKAVSKKDSTQRYIHVHFDWEGGKPCVTHIEAY